MFELTPEEIIEFICGDCTQEDKWQDEDCRVCRRNMESATRATVAKLANMSDEKMREALGEIICHYCDPQDCYACICLKEHDGRFYCVEPRIFQISALFTARLERERELLEKAVGLIKSWHNMDAELKLGHNTAEEMWQIYYEHSPEMKEIRQVLKGEDDDIAYLYSHEYEKS